MATYWLVVICCNKFHGICLSILFKLWQWNTLSRSLWYAVVLLSWLPAVVCAPFQPLVFFELDEKAQVGFTPCCHLVTLGLHGSLLHFSDTYCSACFGCMNLSLKLSLLIILSNLLSKFIEILNSLLLCSCYWLSCQFYSNIWWVCCIAVQCCRYFEHFVEDNLVRAELYTSFDAIDVTQNATSDSHLRLVNWCPIISLSHNDSFEGIAPDFIHWCSILIHQGRVTNICVSKLTTVGSENGLSPRRHQAFIWTNAGILLVRNFCEILIKIHTFSFKKIHLKMSSGKWQPFCLGLNVLQWVA